MAIYPDGYINAQFRFRVSGRPDEMLTTLGIKHSAADADRQTLVDAIAEAWPVAVGAANMVASYTYLGVICVFGPQPGNGPTLVGDNEVVGSASADPPPNNGAILVTKLTGFGGRRNRGRMFLPPCLLDEGDVGGYGVISPANVTAIQTNVDNWVTELRATTDLDDLVILHNELLPGGLPTPITSFRVEAQLASQRRRMRR